jgi:hypothetical protein
MAFGPTLTASNWLAVFLCVGFPVPELHELLVDCFALRYEKCDCLLAKIFSLV